MVPFKPCAAANRDSPLPLDGGGSETCQLAGLVAAVGVWSWPEDRFQGRTVTPIRLRLAPTAQGFVSFPHQGGRRANRSFNDNPGLWS